MRRHWVCVGLMAVLPALAAAQESGGAGLDAKPIAKIPGERTKDFRLVSNADISRVAILDRFENGHWYVDLNDVIWGFYEEVDAGSAQFSPDGKQFAFFGEREGEWHLVCEKKEMQDFGAERPHSLVFSKNSAHMAWVRTLKSKRQQVCVDGKAVAEHAMISHLALTTDGSHVIYSANDGRKVIIGKDGQALGSYEDEEVTVPAWSADDGHVIWAILRKTEKGKAVDLISDGKVVESYAAKAEAGELTLCPDGKRVAWIEPGPGGANVMINGKPVGTNDEKAQHLVWSPEGGHWACIGERKIPVAFRATRTLIIDGDEVDSAVKTDTAPKFSADGRIVRYGEADSGALYFDGKRWDWGRDLASADGRIKVAVSYSGVYVNGVDTGYEKLIDVHFAETGKAYVLVESPRRVHVNEKILNQLTRITVKAER